MEEIAKNTKLYKKGKDYEFEEYTYIGKRDDKYLLQTKDGIVESFNRKAFDFFSFSRVIILRELEEELRLKLDKVLIKLREFKLAYNPVNTVEMIYAHRRTTKVHQYDVETGLYIKSFDSVSEALLSVGKSKKHTGITNVCKGIRVTAYGFRWSYNKDKRI